MSNLESGAAAVRPVVYGLPSDELVDVPQDALQVSPLIPGSARLEDMQTAALPGSAVVLAPPGTAERRYALALVLRALSPGETLVVLAPKDRGGSRLGKELAGFGCAVSEEARRHHRICTVSRPVSLDGLDEAIERAARAMSTTSPSVRSPASSPGIGSIPAARCCSSTSRKSSPARAQISVAGSVSWRLPCCTPRRSRASP